MDEVSTGRAVGIRKQQIKVTNRGNSVVRRTGFRYVNELYSFQKSFDQPPKTVSTDDDMDRDENLEDCKSGPYHRQAN